MKGLRKNDALKIAIGVSDAAARYNSDRYRTSSISYRPESPMKAISLYEGLSGLAYFEAELFGITRKAVHISRALEYISLSKKIISESKRTTSGLFSGVGGLAWAQIRLAEVSGRDTGIAETLATVSANRNPIYDIIFGASGRLLVFLREYRRTGNERYLDEATKESDIILGAGAGGRWVSSITGTVFYGFSHGVAGAAYALMELYNVKNDRKLLGGIDSSLDLILKKAIHTDSGLVWEHGNEDDRVWPHWCHGSSGILIALIESERCLNQNKEYIKDAIRPLRRAIFGVNSYGLCHGLAGIGESLVEVNRSYGSGLVLRDINAFLGLDMTLVDGLIGWQSKPKPEQNIKLMNDSIGTAHYLLRYFNKDKVPHFSMLPETDKRS